jgi:hypothetical protein
MLRSWAFPLVLLMAWHGFGASAAGDVEAKVRIAVQANDPAAQVSSVDGSPVSGLYSTTIDGVSGTSVRMEGTSSLGTCSI